MVVSETTHLRFFVFEDFLDDIWANRIKRLQNLKVHSLSGEKDLKLQLLKVTLFLIQ